MNKIKEKISFFIIFFIALVCSSVICFSSGNKVEAWSGWADSLYYNVSNQPSGSGYSGSQFLLTVSSSGTYGQNDGGFYYLGNNAHLSVQISRMAYYETAKLSSWNDAVWSYNWCNADWTGRRHLGI